MLALGLVETIGLLPAVEAADAMLKSADVRLLERNFADAGLVTVTVAGEVSAVKASVEAAVERVRSIPGAKLVSAHVIPRPDGELEGILKLNPDAPKPAAPQGPSGGQKPAPVAPPAVPAGTPKASVSAAPAPTGKGAKAAAPADLKPAKAALSTRQRSAQKPEPVKPAKAAPAAQAVPDEARLRLMSLKQLRQMARNVQGLPMTEAQMASADKKALIAAILRAFGK